MDTYNRNTIAIAAGLAIGAWLTTAPSVGLASRLGTVAISGLAGFAGAVLLKAGIDVASGRGSSMEKTPAGTSVGVDDPYAFVERCDHLTDDGRCRYALEHDRHDPEFAHERRADDFACPIVTDADPDWDWADCPHFRARNRSRECVRCGLDERRQAHSDERPLLEEYHLSYADTGDTDATDDGEKHDGDGSADEPSHEITVFLCRWCHAKIHESWARIDDDATPDPEAIAAREGRRSRERDELGFSSAAERYGGE